MDLIFKETLAINGNSAPLASGDGKRIQPSPSAASLCACAAIRKASRAVSHLYDLVLQPVGMKSTQFIILRAIAAAGELAHCDLARELGASEETLSRRLATARKANWATMTVGKGQRRIYRLTEQGKKLLDTAIPYWERAENRLRGQLGASDRELLRVWTDRVREAAIRAERTPSRNTRPTMSIGCDVPLESSAS